MAKRLLEIASTSGAIAQNIEYFTSDILPNEASKLILAVSGTAVDIQITFDSGTTWVDLTSALTANTYTELSIHANDDSTINFRTTNASGITLDFFRLYKVTVE